MNVGIAGRANDVLVFPEVFQEIDDDRLCPLRALDDRSFLDGIHRLANILLSLLDPASCERYPASTSYRQRWSEGIYKFLI